MRLEAFNYSLPEELIAQSPAEPRDSARMLVLNRSNGQIQHCYVRDLPSVLPSQTLTVLNTSRVRPSRIPVLSTGGKQYEILLLSARNQFRYTCLVGGGRVRTGDQYTLLDGSKAIIIESIPGPGMSTSAIQFTVDPLLLAEIPLPPYIQQYQGDRERYQTVYAEQSGSAAAPTAGLHLTKELIAQLQPIANVTLHVGLGTFLPLREAEITNNRLHSEQTNVTMEEAEKITQCIAANKPLLAVGTTSLRTLESRAVAGLLRAGEESTDLFIQPGYRFQTATSLLTNFHLPKSSLLVLLTAFLANSPDREIVRSSEQALEMFKKAYAEAIKERYRFFSFGDAMLVL